MFFVVDVFSMFLCIVFECVWYMLGTFLCMFICCSNFGCVSHVFDCLHRYFYFSICFRCVSKALMREWRTEGPTSLVPIEEVAFRLNEYLFVCCSPFFLPLKASDGQAVAAAKLEL